MLLSKTRKLTVLETREFESTWEQLLPQLQRRIALASARAGAAGVSTPLSTMPGVSTNEAYITPLAGRQRSMKGIIPRPEDTTPARSFKPQHGPSTVSSSSQLAKRKRAESNSKIPIVSPSSALLLTADKENAETHMPKRSKTTTSTPLGASSSNLARKPRGQPAAVVPLDDKENKPSAATVQGARRKQDKNNQQPVPGHILRENMNIQNGVLNKGKQKDNNDTTVMDRPVLGARTNQPRQQQQQSGHTAATTIHVPPHTTRQPPRRAQIVLPTDENSRTGMERKGSHMAANKTGKPSSSSSTTSTAKPLHGKPRLQLYADSATPAVVAQPAPTLAKVKKEPDSHKHLLGKLRSAVSAGPSSRSASPSTSHNTTLPPPPLSDTATAPATKATSHILHLQCTELDTIPSAGSAMSRSAQSTTTTPRVVEYRDPSGKVVLEIPGSEEDYEIPVEDPRADDGDDAALTEPYVHSQQPLQVVQASQEDELENANLEDFIETLPVPEFLQELEEKEGEEEETNVGGNANAYDTPTQPQESVNSENGSGGVIISQTAVRHRPVTIVESSIKKDGVWCLEQPERQVKNIICGRKSGWVAVESQHDLDFWKLSSHHHHEADDGARWKLAFSYPKEGSVELRVVFSEQDSHAVIMSSQPNASPSLSVVDLQDQDQRVYPVKVDWNGLQVSDDCEAWLTTVTSSTEAPSMLLVLGCKNEAGAVIALSIPKDVCTAADSTLQATKFNTADASTTIDSLQLVDDCEGLCLTTFEDKLMLWDLSMLDQGPLSTANISTLSTASANTPSFYILQATIPQELYDEYADVIQAGLLTQRDWPIYVVLEARFGSERAERMTTVLMNGQLEVVQRYSDYSSGAACTSSTLLFIESMVISPELSTLTMWDLTKADKLATLSVKMTSESGGPRSADYARETYLEATSSAAAAESGQEFEEGSGSSKQQQQQCVRKLSLASSLGTGSTLSSPPEGLAVTSQSSTEESEGEGGGGDSTEPGEQPTLPRTASAVAPTGPKGATDGSMRVGQWMAMAVAAEQKKSKQQTTFSLHPKQPWLVMACSSPCGGNDDGSMVHIIDVSTLLS
ncbi:hypothetical protein DFQ26_003920 [Actinomortierella ambigua]|nr:hypothetical protein DFQ26_003920 [Actinomortierella ambigua]